MSEPVYRFVKGEGWIFTTRLFDCRYESTVDDAGNTVYILDRNPTRGERFVAYYEHEKDGWYNDNGVIFEAPKRHISNKNVLAFSPWDGSPLKFRACTLIVENE